MAFDPHVPAPAVATMAPPEKDSPPAPLSRERGEDTTGQSSTGTPATDPPTLSPVEAFIELYVQAAKALPDFRLPLADPVQVDGDRDGRTTAILFYLGYEGPCRMSDVSDLFDVHPSTATLLVEKWVQEGLIVRTGSSTDRRVVQLELAEKGRGFFDQIRAEVRRAMRFLLAALDPAEQREFIRLFKKMVDSIP